MEQENPCMLAVSRAGHDRGSVYVVLDSQGELLLLADGKNKHLDQPKRKNRKHVQLIKHIPDPIAEAMKEIRNDDDIRKILKMYNSRNTRSDSSAM